MTIDHRKVVALATHETPFVKRVDDIDDYQVTTTVTRYTKSVWLTDRFKTAALDLNFAYNKSLTDSITGNNLVTFNRASSGTYVGADGLIKTTPVNLLTYSEQLDLWTKYFGATVTSNNIAAPDGTVTADLIDISAQQYSQVLRNFSVKPSTTYTVSFYGRSVTGTEIITLYRPPSRGGSVEFTLTTEWQRFTNTYTSLSTDTSLNNVLFTRRAGSTNQFYIWGVQVEEGSVATDYIPTGATISGAPRFDHDPVTGESLGLLIEESRTNKIYYSQDLTTGGGNRWKLGDGAFTGTNNSFPLAPDGVSKMWLVNLDSTSGTTSNGSRIYASNMAFGSVANVFSFYARSVSGTGNFPAAYFDGSNYIKIYIPLTTTTKRYIIYIPANTGGSIVGFSRRGTTHDETLTQAYVWGCQCEEGNFVTSHIPTFGSQATRATDIVEITGNNFSSFYNTTEGSLFASYSSPLTSGSNDYDILTLIIDNDSNRRLQFFVNLNGSPPQLGLRINNGQGVQRIAVLTETKPFLNFKSSASFGPNLTGIPFANDPRFATNNVLQTASSGSTIVGLPSFTKLAIGRRPNGGGRSINGHFKRVAYFTTRISDNTLQAITT